MDNKIQHNSLLNYLQKVIAVFLISIFYASLVTAQPSTAPDYKSWKQIQKKDNIVAYIGTTKVKTATPIKVEMKIDNNGTTQLTHINETLFGGKIPGFLMEWANYSQPFHTMKTLRDHIINKKLKPTNIQNK